jgi:hypothetical protein
LGASIPLSAIHRYTHITSSGVVTFLNPICVAGQVE